MVYGAFWGGVRTLGNWQGRGEVRMMPRSQVHGHSG